MSQDSRLKIYEWMELKFGLNHSSLHPKVVENALKERMEALQLQSPAEYSQYLFSHPKEQQEFIELMVVPETWFFRDRSPLEFGVRYLIDKWIVHQLPVRVLSAPCSTGEEAYSIALLLQENGVSPKNYSIEGVDISKKVLLQANRAVYGKNSFRENDSDIQTTYFFQAEGGFSLSPEWTKSVHFIYGNLCDPSFFSGRKPYQAIFCRNLLIYLSPQQQQVLLQRFKKLLDKNGIIIVSGTESEIVRKGGFTPLGDRKYCAFTVLSNSSSTSKRAVPKGAIEGEKPHSPTKNQEDLLKEAQYLADKGEYSHALEICFRLMGKYGPQAEAYFLIGVIRHAVGNEEESERNFLKAVEVDPTHEKALVYLSLLADTKGDSDAAAHYRARAKKKKKGE